MTPEVCSTKSERSRDAIAEDDLPEVKPFEQVLQELKRKLGELSTAAKHFNRGELERLGAEIDQLKNPTNFMMRGITGVQVVETTGNDIQSPRYDPEKLPHYSEIVLPEPTTIDPYGLFQHNRLHLLYGEGGSFKSTLAVDVWRCSGRPGVYFDHENPSWQSIHRRLKLPLPNNLMWFNQRWTQIDGKNEMPGGLEPEMIEFYKKRKGDGLILIIDSLAKIMARKDLDENSAKDVRKVLDQIRELLVHDLTIIVLAHKNRQGQFRGSAAIKDSVDVMLGIDAEHDSDSNRVRSITIHPEKCRDLVDKIVLKFDDETGTFSRDEHGETDAKILGSVLPLGSKKSRPDIIKALKGRMGETKIDQLLKQWVKQGFVNKESGGSGRSDHYSRVEDPPEAQTDIPF